jgi:hypothetical protein
LERPVEMLLKLLNQGILVMPWLLASIISMRVRLICIETLDREAIDDMIDSQTLFDIVIQRTSLT